VCEHPQRPGTHGQAGAGAERGDDQALNQELEHQPASRSAERRANAELAAARQAPRQLQARKVRARNEEDEAGRAGQERDRRSQGPAALGVERHDRGGGVLVAIRKEEAVLACRGLHVRDGLLDRHARFQAGDEPEVVSAVVGGFRWRQGHAEPRVDRRAGREAKGRRHHADNGVRIPGKPNRSAHHVRVAAEALPPQGLAQDGGRVSGPHVRIGQCATQERRHAEDREVAAGDHPHVELRGIARAGEIHGRPKRVVGRKAIEGTRVALPVDEVAGRHGVGLVTTVLSVGLPDPDEPIGMGIGEWLQDHLPRDAKHRGIGADPERQRQNRSGGKSRLLPKAAKGISDVVEDRGHGEHSPAWLRRRQRAEEARVAAERTPPGLAPIPPDRIPAATRRRSLLELLSEIAEHELPTIGGQPQPGDPRCPPWRFTGAVPRTHAGSSRCSRPSTMALNRR
jgi:hypothetical protein